MISMLTGCGNDTTKITEGMQLVETLDYQGALTAFDEAEAQKENSRLISVFFLIGKWFYGFLKKENCTLP